jgi:hypothetical protein
MDPRTVSRMKLLERSNMALTAENARLSAKTLEMADRLDQAVKSSHVDRLLAGALIRHFAGRHSVELSIAEVDALRLELGTPPGLSVQTTKDAARGVWVITLQENAPAMDGGDGAASPRPSLIVVP